MLNTKLAALLAASVGMLAGAFKPVSVPGPYRPTRGRQRHGRSRMRERGKFTTIARPPNPKAKNRGKGFPKRQWWAVCNPDDRAALAEINAPFVRGWREGEPVVHVRHASSLTPGARR